MHQLQLQLSYTLLLLTEIISLILSKHFISKNPYENENQIILILKYMSYQTVIFLYLLFLFLKIMVSAYAIVDDMNVYGSIILTIYEFFLLLYQNLTQTCLVLSMLPLV